MIAQKTELSELEKERITKDFLPFIKYTAYRLSWRLPPELAVEDLVSVGIIGLLEALGRYREEEGKLTTFVEYRIKGAMLDELRNHSNVPKSVKKKADTIKRAFRDLERELGRVPEDEEVAESLSLSLDDYYEILRRAHGPITLRFQDFAERTHDEDGIDITECLADPNAKSPLEVLEVNSRNRELARLIDKLPEKERLVLSLYYWEELTMKEIGRVMSLSEGRVCQLHSQAVIKLKAKLNGCLSSWEV